MKKTKNKKETVKDIILNLLLICCGSALAAIGINGILLPRQFVSGGIVGVAIGMHYFAPFVSLSAIYFILNIPLFLLGWKTVGRRFFYYSLAGLIILSAFIQWISFAIPIEDKMLSALLAGIFVGTGAGIILKSKGSSGGLDILSIFLLNRFGIKIGNTILCANGIVLVFASIFLSLEAALYTMVYLFVSSKVLDIVLTGLNQRKAIIIISVKWEEISDAILNEVKRGVTFIKGEGGYSRQEENILYTIVTLREFPKVKRIARNIDPKAFLVVHETMEVIGYRIGNQPHW
ncbi:MAG: YitT family protein [Deltaproteobacteria bacterium]|nr:YitT family protein [Deltaproteobacteria bacterium]